VWKKCWKFPKIGNSVFCVVADILERRLSDGSTELSDTELVNAVESRKVWIQRKLRVRCFSSATSSSFYTKYRYPVILCNQTRTVRALQFVKDCKSLMKVATQNEFIKFTLIAKPKTWILYAHYTRRQFN